MTEEVKAEHTLAEHQHGGPDCEHVTVQHDHVDFIHDGHRHAYDEHDDPAEHTPADHQHGGPDCTHEAVQHGDHVDYVHEGHRHAEHEGHYDGH